MVLDAAAAARAVECGPTDELARVDADDYAVLLFYAYRDWRDQRQFRDAQEALCVELNLAGRLRVAADGLNGTLGGARRALEAYVAATRAQAARQGTQLDGVDWKWGVADPARPLGPQRLRGLSVRLAQEVVSLEACGTEAARKPRLETSVERCHFVLRSTGGSIPEAAPARHVDAAEFHAYLRRGDAVLLDVRNARPRRPVLTEKSTESRGARGRQAPRPRRRGAPPGGPENPPGGGTTE